MVATPYQYTWIVPRKGGTITSLEFISYNSISSQC